MFVTIVYVTVKPGSAATFLEACRLNHEASRQEDGNLRFDILQDHEDENRFVLYEAYTTQEASRRHKDTPHYAKWRDTVADMMAAPRKGVSYQGHYPLFL